MELISAVRSLLTLYKKKKKKAAYYPMLCQAWQSSERQIFLFPKLQQENAKQFGIFSRHTALLAGRFSGQIPKPKGGGRGNRNHLLFIFVLLDVVVFPSISVSILFFSQQNLAKPNSFFNLLRFSNSSSYFSSLYYGL
ncbi:hypothetical protein VNO78_23287 [Psophocarpus tetragonolobus]|uniref:Uncharacterized protein n=1 Tax=Psophocarpus tetragonolobus TaxID=3891 RepID=A0AAN9XDW4_PSOTE